MKFNIREKLKEAGFGLAGEEYGIIINLFAPIILIVFVIISIFKEELITNNLWLVRTMISLLAFQAYLRFRKKLKAWKPSPKEKRFGKELNNLSIA